MKGNKKGFTLIELLAVIIILAVIALIAVPVIMNILNKANKSAFKDTAYGILSAGELYFAEHQLELKGKSKEATFTLPDTTGKIQIKGNVPEDTVLKVNTNGETALAMSNGRYCITKGYPDKEITITEEFENCYVPYTLKAVATTSDNVTSIAQCATDGTICESGTPFAIKVNAKDTYKFYVLNDDGDTITLIMSKKLGDKVAWYAEAEDNSYGPRTAINYLNELTDKEWSNIPTQSYTYSGLGEDGIKKIYEDITMTMRARMITYGELNDIQTANNGTMPYYMYEGVGYMTSTARTANSVGAWYLYSNGIMNGINVSDVSACVRPVIELSK